MTYAQGADVPTTPFGWAVVVLPFVAVAISLVALWRTERGRQRDEARVEVKLTTFAWSSPLGAAHWALAFEAVNRGRQQSTVVTGFLLQPTLWAKVRYRAGAKVLMPNQPVIEVDKLPATLGPGQSVTFPVDTDLVVENIRACGMKPRHYRPWAQTGHGRARGTWAKVGLASADNTYRDLEATAHSKD